MVMGITLVASVVFRKGKFEIGNSNGLLYTIPDDLRNFKKTTTGNTIVMGMRTWESLPNKPLIGRTNIVITSKQVDVKYVDTLFMTLSQFKKLYHNTAEKKYFVIGGGTIYEQFLKDPELYPSDMIITHITTNEKYDVDTYIYPELFKNYEITRFSENFIHNNLSYRYIYYKYTTTQNQEYTYLNFLMDLRNNGVSRQDRTNTGTVSKFGNQLEFDISKSIPLLTTRKVPFKAIVEELLWMCRGDTSATVLQKSGVKIWDGNTSREFLDSRGLEHYPVGTLGPQYGFLWRHFGAKYSPKFSDTSKCDTSIIGGFDQLKYVEDLLKNDPFSRRIIVSAWSPDRMSEQCLPSCHYSYQFYVTETDGQKYLSCMFNMRSNDCVLGLPFNLVSYTILTYILAKRHDMLPYKLIYSCGDSHIYKSHLETLDKQFKREPRTQPCLELSNSVRKKDWKDMKIDDFKLVGYFPHDMLKMDMAI